MGWIILGVPILISSIIFGWYLLYIFFFSNTNNTAAAVCCFITQGMFPKTLPRAAVRKAIHKERLRRELSVAEPEIEKPSIKGKL